MNKISSHSKYPFEYVYYFSSLAQETVNEPILEFFTDVHEEPTDLIADFLNEQDDIFDFLTIPFPRKSRLHSFCEHIFTTRIIDNIYPEADQLRRLELEEPGELFLTTIFEIYQIPHTSFESWSDEEGLLSPNPCYEKTLREAEDILNEYYNFLSKEGSFQKICKIIADEMFFILFINRNFLRKFNLLLSEYFRESEYIKLTNNYLRNEKLMRQRIPQWIKRAILYRDRGKCSFCQRDISGLLSISNMENFDHIVPLALGGLNDVTNFQLLCENCNNTKKHLNSDASIIYERWY